MQHRIKDWGTFKFISPSLFNITLQEMKAYRIKWIVQLYNTLKSGEAVVPFLKMWSSRCKELFLAFSVHKVRIFIIYTLCQKSERNLNKGIYKNKILSIFCSLVWCYLILHLVFNIGKIIIILILNIIKYFVKNQCLLHLDLLFIDQSFTSIKLID